MSGTYRTTLSVAPASLRTRTPDHAAARLAAAATRAPVAVVWREGGDVEWASGDDGHDGPLDAGPGMRRLLPVLAANLDLARRVPSLADHPLTADLDLMDREGLESVATASVGDATGSHVGMVAVFDHVPREWSDLELDQLDNIASLIAREASPGGVGELATVAREATTALERSFASDGVQSLVEHAAGSDDPALRRMAWIARTALDEAADIRSRARRALRSTTLDDPVTTRFDVVPLVRDAVADVCRAYHAPTLGVSSTEATVPAAGDRPRAEATMRRALSAALASAQAHDVSVHVTTHHTAADDPATAVAEVAIDIRGARLAIADFARIATGQPIGSGSGPASVAISVAAGETRLDAPGLVATATVHGTWITVQWPLVVGDGPSVASPW